VMVTHQLTGTTMRQVNEQPIPAALIIIVLFILLAIAITQTGFEVIGKFPSMPTVAAIGTALMTVYVLPFEIVSLVLLVALIGAIIIARRD